MSVNMLIDLNYSKYEINVFQLYYFFTRVCLQKFTMMWIFSKKSIILYIYIIIIIKYYYTYKSLYVFVFNSFANMSDSRLLTGALAHNKLHVPTDKLICIMGKTVCAL